MYKNLINLQILKELFINLSFLSFKGMIELQHAVTQTLMDSKLFPHLAEDVSRSVIYLYGAILQLRENHAVLVSWDHYLQLASDAGVAEVDIEQATAVLEFKVWEKSLAREHLKLNPSTLDVYNESLVPMKISHADPMHICDI